MIQHFCLSHRGVWNVAVVAVHEDTDRKHTPFTGTLHEIINKD